MGNLTLYDTPEIQRFGGDEIDGLASSLQRLERNTYTESIDDPEQLLLNHKTIRTKHGLRYSSIAFTQLASSLVPGLAKLIPNLWGYRKKEKHKHSTVFYNHALAVDVFNRIVAARVDAVLGQLLVIDRDAKTIVGLITKKYVQLDNSQFINLAIEAVKESVFPVSLHEALLVGRQLSLRFKSAKPLLVLQPDTEQKDRIFVGYCFRNGETHGMAVRSYRAIVTRYGTALWQLKTGKPVRVAHTGSNFDDRVFRVIQGVVVQDMIAFDHLREHVTKLLSQPLGLSVVADARAEQIHNMAGTFVKRGLPRWLSVKIMERAVYVGLRRDNILTGQDLATRTAWNVYCAITNMAGGFDMGRRERLERLAYDFLRGNVTL